MSELPVGQSGANAADVARMAAQAAGRIIVKHHLGDIVVTSKGRGDIVTDVDFTVERQTIELLRREFPGHCILAEERGRTDLGSDYTWIIDPVDGTRNFASGVPHFCFNLALACGLEVILGVTYDAVRDELFFAEKGKGATMNGRPLTPSTKESVREAVIGFELGYDNGRAKEALGFLRDLFPDYQTMRIMGSLALGLAYATCGRYDILFHCDLRPWDVAPSIIFAKEAGAAITTLDGGPVDYTSQNIAIGGPKVHADFLRLWRDRRRE